MSEEQTNFKVTDRRLFNADGSPESLSPEETVEIKARSTRSTPNRRNRALRLPKLKQLPPAPSASAAEQSQPEMQDEIEIPGAEDPASFANFLMSIARTQHHHWE